MKIFDEVEGPWSSKVNFVDDHNVVIGYDTDQCCCEDAYWFIHRELIFDNPTYKERNKSTLLELMRDSKVPEDLTKHYIDTEFCKEEDLDYGNVAVFLLKDMTGRVDSYYLYLVNCHNGYYSHGFTVEHNGTEIRSGSL